MQLFGTKGQKFLLCPGTKGQRDELKILQRDGPGRDSLSNSGTGHRTGRYKILTACPVPQDKTGQSRKGHSKTEKECSKTVKDVLKQKRTSKTGKDVLKQENDIPGQRKLFRDRETFFVPGQRDIGTRKLFFVPGQRDREIFLSRDEGTTGRPVPNCPVPWKP